MLFILERMQEEYFAKEEMFYTCFVDLEYAFHRIPKSDGMSN